MPPRTRVIDAVMEVARETQLSTGLRVTAGQLLERFLFDDEAQKALWRSSPEGSGAASSCSSSWPTRRTC
jgi:hypothetical protein